MLKFIASALALMAVSGAAMAQTQTVRLFSTGEKDSGLSLRVTGEGTVHVRWADGVENDYTDGLLQGKCYGDTITITMPETITGLDCEGANLSWIDVNGAKALASLHCGNNALSALNIDSLALLDELDCSDNNLNNLSTTTNAKLRYLDCADNQIESLDLGANPLLEVLNCSGNPMTELDLSKNDALRGLWSEESNIQSLDLGLCRNLSTVVASHGQLSRVNLGPVSNLKDLWIDHNALTSLDLKGADSLINANLSDNQLESLDLRDFSKQTKISYFNCSNNHLPFASFLPYTKVATYVGGFQDNIYCGYDSVAINEQIDFAGLVTNAGNGRIGVLSAYDAKTGNELKKGNSGSDYQYLLGRVRFYHEIDSVYFTIKSTRYTDLEIRTKAFVVYDPEATAIHSATVGPNTGDAQSSSINEQDAIYYDLYGRRVAVPQRGQIYIHNGQKIVY